LQALVGARSERLLADGLGVAGEVDTGDPGALTVVQKFFRVLSAHF
jgi:hypothetical protein